MTVSEFETIHVGDTVVQDLWQFGLMPVRYKVIDINKTKNPLNGRTVRQVILESEDKRDRVYLWNKQNLRRYRVVSCPVFEETCFPRLDYEDSRSL